MSTRSTAGDSAEPRTPRRRYDSPVRRQQSEQTRERIAQAGAALARELPTWDLGAVTFRAVAERAGVSERTVYRYFATERALRDAVMQQLEKEGGVSYEGITLDDVAAIGAQVFANFSAFRAYSVRALDPTLAAEDGRRRAALLAAVTDAAPEWSLEDRTRAAAVLDVLWSVASYQRLSTRWAFDAPVAAETIEWAVDLVVDAIKEGRRPLSG